MCQYIWAYVHCTLCSNKGSRFYVLFELQLKVYGCFFAKVKRERLFRGTLQVASFLHGSIATLWLGEVAKRKTSTRKPAAFHSKGIHNCNRPD